MDQLIDVFVLFIYLLTDSGADISSYWHMSVLADRLKHNPDFLVVEIIY